MVTFHETIPTKRQIDERLARAASATAFSGLKRQRPITSNLMGADGLPYDSLTPAHWRAIAQFQQPELYYREPLVMPGSEEALGDEF